jgi:hypothetical protein
MGQRKKSQESLNEKAINVPELQPPQHDCELLPTNAANQSDVRQQEICQNLCIQMT